MDGKSPKSGTKTGKNRTKNAKKSKKPEIRASPSYHSGLLGEKTAPALPPGPVDNPKSPKNTPQNLLQKVIHNRRRS